MPIPTIYWKDGFVELIDQTLLPDKLVYLKCGTVKQIWDAIKKLKVRGAPAIGIAAGFGVALGVMNFKGNDYKKFRKKLEEVLAYLFSARPTAVNLPWALERMRKLVDENFNKPVDILKRLILAEAIKILKEDKEVCRKIAGYGEKYIKNGSNVLTHCNAGGLATADYGTALSLLFCAKEDGKKFHVYVDETRPVLQGARLTTWELMQAKIPCTLICDNMAASLMKQKKINLIIVGADRIARNGDTANKIGTYSLSCLAHIHNVPFYIAAPSSTFDLKIPNGGHIPIEERHSEEITHIRGKRIAPEGVKVYNPSFDVTPAEYISAFITERGIINKPFSRNIPSKIS